MFPFTASHVVDIVKFLAPFTNYSSPILQENENKISTVSRMFVILLELIWVSIYFWDVFVIKVSSFLWRGMEVGVLGKYTVSWKIVLKSRVKLESGGGSCQYSSKNLAVVVDCKEKIWGNGLIWLCLKKLNRNHGNRR